MTHETENHPCAAGGWNRETSTAAAPDSPGSGASPIATAPIAANREFGPCLLWPTATGEERWVIGRWNGEEWCDDDCWVFAPTLWAPLPLPGNLAAAEAELAELHRSATLKAAGDEIWDRFVALDAWIAATPPSTLSEVAVKLRRLCDPDSGIETLRDRDVPCLQQVLSFVEALCSADDLKGAGTPDAAALTLFQDWIDLCHRRDEAYEAEEDDKAERLGEQRDDVEAKIASVRGSRAADAIKTFLLVMNKIVQVCGPGGQLRDASLIGDNMITNVLCDAAAVVPQLAELCAPIIHADARLIDADIEVGFLCELPTTNNERWRAERRSKLIAALDCIDATEAKTERGAAIKARWRRGELLASE